MARGCIKQLFEGSQATFEVVGNAFTTFLFFMFPIMFFIFMLGWEYQSVEWLIQLGIPEEWKVYQPMLKLAPMALWTVYTIIQKIRGIFDPMTNEQTKMFNGFIAYSLIPLTFTVYFALIFPDWSAFCLLAFRPPVCLSACLPVCLSVCLSLSLSLSQTSKWSGRCICPDLFVVLIVRLSLAVKLIQLRSLIRKSIEHRL